MWQFVMLIVHTSTNGNGTVDKYISTHTPAYVKWKLKKWLQSPGFRTFAVKYKSKIKSKLSKPTRQQIIDSLAELEAAYLLICQDFSVEYEKYGTRGPSPDLSALKGGMQLNLEVRRIRHSDDEVLLNDAMSEIEQGVRAVPTPLMVNLALDLEEKPGQGFRPAVQDRQGKVPAIIDAIKDEMKSLLRRRHLPCDGSVEVDFRHVFLGINASICRPNLKIDHSYTSCRFITWPGVHTHREHLRCRDIIQKKLKQLRPREPNILLLIIDRDALNPVEVELGLDRILHNPPKSPHKPPRLIEHLSGILVRPRWWSSESPPNIYISNPMASYPLPDSLIKELEQMDEV